ncbi:hypothetical protein L7F22_062238 [Adiantum nelumboides]|nr:hypothetical protein [Adiantum nelumboides]
MASSQSLQSPRQSRSGHLQRRETSKEQKSNDTKGKRHVVEQSPASIGHRQPSTHGLVNGQDSNEQTMRQAIPLPMSNAGCFGGGSVFQAMIRPSPALHGFMPDNAYGVMPPGGSNPMYGNIGVQPGFRCAAGSYGMPGANMGMASFAQPDTQNLNMAESSKIRKAATFLKTNALRWWTTLLGLLNLQTIYGWSDVSVTALFQLLQKILPEGNCMPESRNAAKKTLATLGLDYESIHACPNDHVLFRKELAKEVHCPQCHASRYREDVQGNKVPAKVLRHFPLIPRIKHMFKCKEIAGLMSWHANNKSIDGMMRVPADSPAWKHIETKWPWFEREPRHLRLGLGTDGVNPFGLRSTKWSTWPVVLVNYNIPPWLSIKKGHLILSLLIPGKRKVKDMSVYLAPLIEELQDLWTGIKVVDNSRKGRRKVFNARAILMWTMHDYPGYGDVFYYPMHGDTNWKYVIDVAPRATRVLQSTQELSTIDDVNRILDDNDDDTSEEGGSFSDAKLEYSSTSTDGSASEPENSFLNAFELDTNTDEIDTFSHSSIGLNLEIVLEIDHEDLYADITSVL